MTGNRTLYLAFVASATLFLYAVFHQWGSVTADSIQEKLTSHRFGNETAAGRPDFEQIARKYGTDKVTTHQYQFMYDKYLSGIRDDQLKVLEIGLGCNMDYGPGASYYTWLEYFPHVNLYFIEYDGQCAKKYQDKTPNAHVFVGDQADTPFLAKFSTEATADGLFDIIIDDGGHTMDQQMTSLEFLWKAVKPGGLYVIEDLQTSYWESFGGNPLGRSSSKETTITYLYQLVDDLMIGRNAKQISHDLLSVDCMAEICALRKKEQI